MSDLLIGVQPDRLRDIPDCLKKVTDYYSTHNN